MYYGNWLRDFSQAIVPDTVGFNEIDYKRLTDKYKLNDRVSKLLPTMLAKPSQITWVRILQLLAIKEFVYNLQEKRGETPTQDYTFYEKEFIETYGELTPDILGIYRPEEHLDNPKLLGNDSVFSDKKLQYPILFNYEFPKGIFTERALYAGEKAKSLEINKETNLKRYLNEDIDALRPSSFTYFKEQLLLAKQKGKNKHGLRHFGAALHVLEDFFAHSNFIEISLIKNGYTKVYPWVQMPEKIEKIKKGKASKIPIVTGLFAADDTLASITPKLAAGLFPLNFEEYKRIKSGERTFFDALLLTLLTDLASKQRTLKDKDKKYYLGLSIQDILTMYTTFLNFRDKWAKAEDLPYIGWVFKLVSRASHYLKQSIVFYNNLIFNILLDIVNDAIKEKQTRINTNFGTNPTHTQIAKDEVDHPLNPLAGILAVHAVEDVSRKMKSCWYGGIPINKLIQYIEKTYFTHPSKTTWMDAKIKVWAIRNIGAVKRAESKTIVYHHEKQTKKNLNKFKNELENLKKPPIN